MKLRILLCDTSPGLLPSYIESYPAMFYHLFDSKSCSRWASEGKRCGPQKHWFFNGHG